MVRGGRGDHGTGATLGSGTVTGLLAACACAVLVGRVVDPGRAGTWGALLPSSKPWPELGAQREPHGVGGAEQSKPSGAAARREQNTDKAPLGPGCPTSGEFWACCIKFLEMTVFRFLGIVGFTLQEKLKKVEACCAGADSVALATVFWEALTQALNKDQIEFCPAKTKKVPQTGL